MIVLTTLSHSSHLSAMKTAVALLQSHINALRAMNMYLADFFRLVNRTIALTAKNGAHLHGHLDFSALHGAFEFASLTAELVATGIKESASYLNERSEEISRILLTYDVQSIELFWAKEAKILDTVVHHFPAAEQGIRSRMGMQFDDARRFMEIGETSRLVLYRVLPLADGVTTRMDGKPILHLAPFILPENILDLLPYDGISMLGAFANAGTPTYFVHVRDILDTPAVQTMSEEEFLEDLKYFCELLRDRHHRKVTLSGTCQGALPTLHAVCAPALGIHESVDAWLGIVPAYALAASHRVQKHLNRVPRAHRHLRFITETLPNGNIIVAGEPSALSSRLSNFEKENPFARLFDDIRTAAKGGLSPFASAMRTYLSDIRPMPLRMTEASYRCSSSSIASDGTLPETLFGAPVTLENPIKRGILLHVVAGSKDTVVDTNAALAMFRIPCVREYSGATYHVFDGAGHVALMTTATRPESKNFIGLYGGPLWFHLELEKNRTR